MSPFDWCMRDQHGECIREYKVFTFDAKGKLTYTGEIRKCVCSKRGCKCYVPRKDRPKARRRKK